MTALRDREIRQVGFNESVNLQGRPFHVQTEVLVREQIMIRTTVLEAGAVMFAESHPCPNEALELDAFSALVEAQHKHYVQELNRVGANWLASISKTK